MQTEKQVCRERRRTTDQKCAKTKIFQSSFFSWVERLQAGEKRKCVEGCVTLSSLTGTSAKRKAKEWGKPTGRNGDADGHTLHLGPSPKVNKCSGSHLVKTGGEGVLECKRGWEGQWVEKRVATSTSIWKSRFFLSLQQSGEGKCQHALRPRLTVPRSAPPPGPPCSATEYGQQWQCPTSPQGGHWGQWVVVRGHRRAQDHPHARVYTNTSCYFSHKKHKNGGLVYFDKNSCVSGAHWEEKRDWLGMAKRPALPWDFLLCHWKSVLHATVFTCACVTDKFKSANLELGTARRLLEISRLI